MVPITTFSMGSLLEGFSKIPPGGHAWHQPTHEFAGPSVSATEAENNEVMYKIRRWPLPGTAVMPGLNVSSRVTWLELDDKALLDSYAVLQEGILCDVFRKSAQLHGKVLQDKGLRSPSCCLAAGGLRKSTAARRFRQKLLQRPFFLSGCCMAQRRSLSGRSPFCQLN